MARIRNPHLPPRPCPSPETIKAARKRVAKALTARAPEVARQSKIIVDALKVLKRLHREVDAEDKERHAGYALPGEGFNDVSFRGTFIPRGVNTQLDTMVCDVERIRVHARVLVADGRKKN